MADKIRILIVDDHPIIRHGLTTLLSAIEGMVVVGEAIDGIDAVNKAHDLHPDIILMDMRLPGKNGIEAIQEIMQESTHSRIIILSSFCEDGEVVEAMRSGAKGYILKDSSPDALIKSIIDVHQGGSAIQPSVAQKIIGSLNRSSITAAQQATLSARELEILRLTAMGFTNKEIARQLCVGEGTVRTHISNLLTKLQLENRTQAVLYALREGIVNVKEINHLAIN